MSHISPVGQKELDQDLRTLNEYPLMKPKGDSIIPASKFLNMLITAGSLEELERRTPADDISFAYYMKWADGFKAIDHELEKNKSLNEKIKSAPQDISQYLSCISLTSRLTKKTEELGKYVPDTKKWHQVASEYKTLYDELLKIDPNYARIFLEDITKPIYKETPEAQALATWGHYQALNYLGQYHQQQSIAYLASENADKEKAHSHNELANQHLNRASSQGSNHAMQTIGAKAISGFTGSFNSLITMEAFRVNYELAARRGNPTAMIGLGFSLLHKHPVIDPKTQKTALTAEKIEHALHLLKKAANQDATMAHVHLAGYYYANKMIDKAIEHYKAAIQNEHVPSMLFLARIYMEQRKEDAGQTELVLHYFKMAMAAGNIEARFHIATIYSNTVEWLAPYRNNTQAFSHAFSTAQMKFEDIADKDQRQFVSFSKILLGDFYRDGTTPDKTKDIPKAIEWYKAGVHDFETYPDAFTKNPEEIKLAYYQLGLFYLDKVKEGETKENLSESLENFKKAAKLGHIPSMQIQTQLYEDSLTEFTAENALERIRMHEVIATQAFIDTETSVAIRERKKIAALYSSVILNPKPDYKKAMQVYNTLIEKHQDAEAAYLLGRMYREGKSESGKPNFTEAMRYYVTATRLDKSADKEYTILSYNALGEMALVGDDLRKPSIKIASSYFDKIIALKDHGGYVQKGLLKLKTIDPEFPPNLFEAMAHFRTAKKLGFIFTPEDLHEISEELEKFKESHPEAYTRAVHYDLQLLINNDFLDILLNNLSTNVQALLIYPSYLIEDTSMEAEERVRLIEQYLSRLIEIGTAYKLLPHTEDTIDRMIHIDEIIDACAKALNKPEIQYPANKNLVQLHLLRANPDYVAIKRCLDLLIDQYNDPESAYSLGQMEENGQNATGKPDYQAALKAYELGTRQITTALPVVQCLLAIGNLAYTGKGFPENKPDLQFALTQYRIAANMRCHHAYILIGLVYLTQTDPKMPVNIELAMTWLRQADEYIELSPDNLKRVHQHLESLKPLSDLEESYTKAISYDVKFLEDYEWISKMFFSKGCKPSEEQKRMIPSYVKWVQDDAFLTETDRENILTGFKQYYKAYL